MPCPLAHLWAFIDFVWYARNFHFDFQTRDPRPLAAPRQRIYRLTAPAAHGQAASIADTGLGLAGVASSFTMRTGDKDPVTRGARPHHPIPSSSPRAPRGNRYL
jgi:hypothetical protein